jgi:hypothetical protein
VISIKGKNDRDLTVCGRTVKTGADVGQQALRRGAFK